MSTMNVHRYKVSRKLDGQAPRSLETSVEQLVHIARNGKASKDNAGLDRFVECIECRYVSHESHSFSPSHREREVKTHMQLIRMHSRFISTIHPLSFLSFPSHPLLPHLTLMICNPIIVIISLHANSNSNSSKTSPMQDAAQPGWLQSRYAPLTPHMQKVLCCFAPWYSKNADAGDDDAGGGYRRGIMVVRSEKVKGARMYWAGVLRRERCSVVWGEVTMMGAIRHKMRA